MSVLTKVFVVLVTILSILLVALVVPFVANTQNYRDQLGQTQQRLAAADLSARNAQAELTAAQKQEADRVAALRSESQNLQTQINMLTQRLAQAEANVAAERAKSTKSEADTSRLSAALQQLSQINDRLQTELGQRRQEMVEQQTRMIQLADRNNELTSQLDTLTRQTRRFQEQLTQSQERINELETAIGRLDPTVRAQVLAQDTATATPFEAQTKIQGKVTGVQTIGGDTFVQVNVGKNDGVQPNMKFLVHRGNQFLGTLVITTVDANAAAGRMQLTQGEVASGDAIITGGV